MLEQHDQGVRRVIGIVFLAAARGPVIDRLRGNYEHAGNRDCAEYRRQHEHCEIAVFPTEITGQRCTDQVSGMVERLIAAVLLIEAALFNDA